MNSSNTNSNLEVINKNENEIDNVVIYKDSNSKNQTEKTLQCSENNILNIKSDNEKPFIICLKKNFKIILIVCSIILAVILLIIFLTKKDDDSSLDKIKSSSNNHSSSSINSDDSSIEEEEQYIILPTKEKIVTKLNYYTNEMFIYKEISNSTMKFFLILILLNFI